MSAARRHLTVADTLRFRGFQLARAAARHGGRAAPALAPAIADFASLLAPRQRQAVEANLRVLLPRAGAAEIHALRRGVFRSATRYYVELMRLPVVDLQALHDRVEVEGYERFEAARAGGRGVIVASVHLGPTELLLQAFSARGVYYTAMIERLHPPQLNQLFLEVRRTWGQRYVFADVAGARALLKELRGGGVVAMLVDRDVTGTGIAVPFAGGVIRAPSGVIDLARASGAPILPTVAAWTASGYRATFMEPLSYGRETRGEEATRRALAQLLRRFTPYLLAHPEQWLVLEPLFVSRGRRSGAAYTET
jgi:lauroyl/myristoyl acyltransferase